MQHNEHDILAFDFRTCQVSTRAAAAFHPLFSCSAVASAFFPRDAAAVILFHLLCFLCFFVSDAPWDTVNKSESLSAPAFAVVVWSLVFPSTYLTWDIPFETSHTSDRQDHGALRLL